MNRQDANSDSRIRNITGIVLAGGKSTRMGTDKALLHFRGKTLIECVLETMTEIFSRVLLSVHQEEAYPALPFPKVTDHYREIGPIGGITSVLESGESRIFCAACDMPFLNKVLIEYLCSLTDYDAVIPVWNGKQEVLHALYSRRLLPSLHQALSSHHYRITDALSECRVCYVAEEQIRKLDPEGLSFRNLNSPPDYERAAGMLDPPTH